MSPINRKFYPQLITYNSNKKYEWFSLEHNDFMTFHPLITVEVKTRAIFDIFKYLREI